MQIDHVVVLCLENRSFDHMLGYLDHPDPRFEGIGKGGPLANPGWDDGPPITPGDGAKPVVPVGPDHSHDAVMEQLGITGVQKPWRPTNQGFVSSYERKVRGLAAPVRGGLIGRLMAALSRPEPVEPTAAGRGPLAMLCQRPDRVPVLATLALEFAVCDHWFCSVPGETWPNRNYLHAASSDGETNIEIRPYLNRTVFDMLEDAGHRWRIYHDDTPQVWAFPRLWDTPDRHGNWFPVTKFAEHVGRGDLAAYSFIEPNHRPALHSPDHQPLLGGRADVSNSQHPENNLIPNADYDKYDDDNYGDGGGADTDFARGEALIASVYETLRGAPELFATTLLLITYDEHGGFYDHVPPPTDAAAPDGGRGLLGRIMHAIWHRDSHPFDFTMLGPRVPTVVVSPHVPRGTLLTETYDHASVPATLRAVFAPQAAPLTKRDAAARPVQAALSLEHPRTDLPDLSRFTAHLSTAGTPPSLGAPPSRPMPPQPATSAAVPDYYRDFIKQAAQVRKRLSDVGEPEIAGVTRGENTDTGPEVTAAFHQAAHRHRHAGDPPVT